MTLADGKSIPEYSHLLAGVIFFLLYFSLTVLLHWAGGVYRGDFGGSPDKAAHYVTGLMVRDIFRRIPGCRWRSRRIITLSEVALGHWPPSCISCRHVDVDLYIEDFR